jgi:hypothetical protein
VKNEIVFDSLLCSAIVVDSFFTSLLITLILREVSSVVRTLPCLLDFTLKLSGLCILKLQHLHTESPLVRSSTTSCCVGVSESENETLFDAH